MCLCVWHYYIKFIVISLGSAAQEKLWEVFIVWGNFGWGSLIIAFFFFFFFFFCDAMRLLERPRVKLPPRECEGREPRALGTICSLQVPYPGLGSIQVYVQYNTERIQ